MEGCISSGGGACDSDGLGVHVSAGSLDWIEAGIGKDMLSVLCVGREW